MKILNLTQHPATPEQVAAGVVEPRNKSAVQSALTFNTLPTREEVSARAEELAAIAASEVNNEGETESGEYPRVMVGGAPFLMGPLEAALRAIYLTPVYAFSVRESRETVKPGGAVEKVAVFRHAGFVAA